MTQFRVGVTNLAVTRGIGPGLIEVPGTGGADLLREQAKAEFARGEQTTVEALEAEGYTWWTVDPVPGAEAPFNGDAIGHPDDAEVSG